MSEILSGALRMTLRVYLLSESRMVSAASPLGSNDSISHIEDSSTATIQLGRSALETRGIGTTQLYGASYD